MCVLYFSQVDLLCENGDYFYPQCFVPSSRLVNTADIHKLLFELNSARKVMSDVFCV